MQSKVLAIDLAKDVFQLHGVNERGEVVLRKKLSRKELALFTAQLPPCQIAMEACGGSHHWSRRFAAQGHTPCLIPTQFVRPFKRTVQKNDQHDAAAICEAAQRPTMRFVPAKSLHAQDLQTLHRLREQLVKARTAFINQCRGLAMEYGVVMSEGRHNFQKELPVALEEESELTAIARQTLGSIKGLVDELNTRLTAVEKQIAEIASQSQDYARLMSAPGVGPLTASLMLVAVSDVSVFKNGRHLSAWIGLVPRQHSPAGQTRLRGITKAGDANLRVMLIHGARALITSVRRKNGTDRLSQWILRLLETKGWNITAVAVANRNCRVMWHLLKYQEEYNRAC